MSCKCKKIWYAVAAVLVVIVAADVAYMLSKCKCGAGDEEKAPEAVPVPVKPQIPTAQERTASKVAARLADPEYMATLKTLENRQQELAAARSKVLAEFKAWRDAWVASNPAAKAVSDKINAYIASKNGKIEPGDKEFEALEAEFKKLILADPVGAEIQGRLEAIAAEEKEHHDLIVSVIGSRLRRDMEAGAGIEAAATAEWRKEHAPEGDPGFGHPKKFPPRPNLRESFSKAPVPPPGTNMPTNSPGYRAPTNAAITVRTDLPAHDNGVTSAPSPEAKQ